MILLRRMRWFVRWAFRRRRKIGIRSALGAQPWRVVADIFLRALSPVAAGALAGALLALPIGRFLSVTDEAVSLVTFSASVALMLVIGLLAAIGPARRVVRVDATEALREG